MVINESYLIGALWHVLFPILALWFTNMTRMWVYTPFMPTFINAFLLNSYLTHTPDISIKVKLGLVINFGE